MGKKTKLSIVAFVIFVIGGIIMFSLNQKRAQTEAQQIRHEQERIVQYIGEHIELMDGKNIDKIEFVEFQKNDMTGTWRITTKINNKYNISFSVNKLGEEIEIANYSPSEFKQNDKKKRNKHTNNVEIIYFKR
ncbi:MAG: hypothetical protein HXO88_01760 [Streptococcus intermedius]|uniref:DUF1433 domain-containing protein n=1 Tax=Streptococcus intermedius TaxID=1338 RepID=A0A930RB75_STRIT|nr:hypothetical protein [Streptococcus intermedius]